MPWPKASLAAIKKTTAPAPSRLPRECLDVLKASDMFPRSVCGGLLRKVNCFKGVSVFVPLCPVSSRHNVDRERKCRTPRNLHALLPVKHTA